MEKSKSSKDAVSSVESWYKALGDAIRKTRPEIKASTLDLYLRNLRTLSTNLFKKPIFSPRYFFDVESVKGYLQNHSEHPSTISNFAISIIVYLKTLGPRVPEEVLKAYTEWHHQLTATLRQTRSAQQKSDKESSNWMTPSEFQALKAKLQNQLIHCRPGTTQHLDLFQRLLVLTLYTDIPPIRNDYANVIVISKPDLDTTKINCDVNYVNLATSKLILCNYKTAKAYGVKSIDLPQHIVTMIRIWMKDIRPHAGHNYLLVNIKDASRMTKNGLTKFLNKVCAPKKVSTCMLRKMYLSEKYPVVHTFNEMQKDSYIMGHSIGTQQNVYRRQQ